MADTQELLEMLTYARPAGSKSERRFINRYLRPLPGARQDDAGNIIVKVGESTTLYSSHTDTVHRRGGPQKVATDGHTAFIGSDLDSNCLGADCTTGVWLMVNMIRAGKPGLYVFHREEEVGGRGSLHISRRTPELLAGIERAIAFDRYGTKSIITHQAWDRCCSEKFAVALAARLGLGMGPDDGGTFTDTANYTDLVGECTNISVGYYSQHTRKELQDLDFASRLLDALLEADIDTLPTVRMPGEVDADWRSPSRYSTGKDWWMDHAEPVPSRRAVSSVLDLVREYPEEVADWLETNGIGASDLMLEIEDRRYDHPFSAGAYKAA